MRLEARRSTEVGYVTEARIAEVQRADAQQLRVVVPGQIAYATGRDVDRFCEQPGVAPTLVPREKYEQLAAPWGTSGSWDCRFRARDDVREWNSRRAAWRCWNRKRRALDVHRWIGRDIVVQPARQVAFAAAKPCCHVCGGHPWIELGADDAAMRGPRPAQGIIDKTRTTWVEVDVADLPRQVIAVADRNRDGKRLPLRSVALAAGEAGKTLSECAACGVGVLHGCNQVQMVRHQARCDSVREPPSQYCEQCIARGCCSEWSCSCDGVGNEVREHVRLFGPPRLGLPEDAHEAREMGAKRSLGVKTRARRVKWVPSRSLDVKTRVRRVDWTPSGAWT